ncbi:restriction endonuclease [Stenotrophomonas maltophilia]|uniref:Restriction endonuclease n=1 Tax=Stenotrophomonas maltophilia TaxID=40324 RepID=A0AA40Y902_STEMA|nr:restriction endonuclease [Stenotrophomonas pavanii]MBH1640992.1 restriction endonuclease [Stenotrophomonas maltophilia]MCI1076319.1 restriction endonuclease [Stenotrophomonas maltophilia]MCI1088493.1 restriction endonuclease [Stenotrophomonas maltophilia]MCI1117712.1 restriction endonuclease [Stenotrophomonas maltophilia]
MVTTRTIGPLHFEDLEPKRFEDLVRQLAYEFKPWRRLEATGRSGNDDGFDARGYEIVANATRAAVSGDEDRDTVEEPSVLDEGRDDRLWLIQCKRERAIGPKALIRYLDDTVLGADEKLHGLVFTAASDFSKKARDEFAKKCREMGLEEWHLWGKAELEDRLFRPENDHLLFAYFGVSLTIRRRSQRADLRARLVMKRKAHRMLEDHINAPLLLRSPDAVEYPYPGDLEAFKKDPRWGVLPYRGMSHGGLKFCVERYFAYLSDDGESWDAAMAVNDVRDDGDYHPWTGEDRRDKRRAAIRDFYDTIPKANKAWLEIVGLVPFEDVLEIDDLGDEFVSAPHVYAAYKPGPRGPFKGFVAEVETISHLDYRTLNPRHRTDGRITYFPAELREDAESD